jgi:predicted small lipoprotein YifL
MPATRIRVPALLLATVLALGACGRDGPPPQPVAPTPATTFLIKGELATPVTRAWADLRTRLREHYDPPSWDVRAYSLPASMSWETIVAHYAGELGADWKEDTRYKEDGSIVEYRAKVWSDGDRAVGIALVQGRPAGSDNVLAVLLPEDDR